MKTKIYLFLLMLINFNSNAQLSWLQMPDFPGGKRWGVASFSINNKGYMGLGTDANSVYYSDWYEYDPITNQWTQLANVPANGTAFSVSFSIGSKGYVIGGASNGRYSNAVYEFDPVTKTWTIKTPMPDGGRQNAAGFSLNGLGYVGTGSNGTSLNDFYAFDPVANTWTPKASFPGIERNGASGFTAGDKGYIGMGNNSNATFYPNDLYEYDPNQDVWTQKANFPLSSVNSPTTYSSSKDGYVLCGYFYQYAGITHNPMNMFYKYAPLTDTWTLLGTFPGLPRGYAGGFTLMNDIYIGTGAQSNGGNPRFSDFWKLSNGLSLFVKDHDNLLDFDILPNPSSKYIYIGDIKGKQPKSIRIYDFSGKLIKIQSIKDVKQAIDISTFSSGLYFMELTTKDGYVLDCQFMKE
ncbi:MAG: T9SS type A sorting domain-containing protein [Saprospiraceae bacterium]|nr:T9SS type A sorting domain-containing protein [Candidatus Defluviibacterium haderslevense]